MSKFLNTLVFAIALSTTANATIINFDNGITRVIDYSSAAYVENNVTIKRINLGNDHPLKFQYIF